LRPSDGFRSTLIPTTRNINAIGARRGAPVSPLRRKR
jgi:hypothetical protein